MGKMDSFLKEPSGYLRTDAPPAFVWKNAGRDTSSVWFLLLTVENGKMHHYGFTSGGAQKYLLAEALRSLTDDARLFVVVRTCEDFKSDGLYLVPVDEAKLKLA